MRDFKTTDNILQIIMRCSDNITDAASVHTTGNYIQLQSQK